jgi:DNA-directed RNA polymerase specialized sigma24 family protein
MGYQWDRVVASIAYGRARAASRLGLSIDDLMSAGRMAAFQAEQTWDPGRGTKLSSWIYAKVSFALSDTLHRGCVAANAKEAVANEPAAAFEEAKQDTVMMLRNAITYLRAELSDSDWTMLWLRYAEGYQPAELARMYGMTLDAVKSKTYRAATRAVTKLRHRQITQIADVESRGR